MSICRAFLPLFQYRSLLCKHIVADMTQSSTEVVSLVVGTYVYISQHYTKDSAWLYLILRVALLNMCVYGCCLFQKYIYVCNWAG